MIIAIGDLHGSLRRALDFPKQTIIQVGDLGVGFKSPSKQLRELELFNNSLKKKDIMMYAIRGNHDDPVYWKGDLELSNLKLVPDYSVLKMEDQNILFMGGAISVDRVLRKTNVDYWKEEGFQYDEEKLTEVVRQVGGIDVVISHSCPEFCYPVGDKVSIVSEFANLDVNLIAELRAERAELARAYNVIAHYNKPKAWYYGHYHRNNVEYINDTKFVCLGIGEETKI